MAEEISKTPKKPRIVKREKETIRQRTEKASRTTDKPRRRLNTTASAASRRLQSIKRFVQKEYYIPLPENKLGRFLNKRRSFMPNYFKQAYAELRQVTWPGRKETWKLTGAVFIFAISFSLLISVTDYGLGKIFRKVFLQ